MKNLILKIEALELKREKGTITFEEDVVFLKLVELAKNFLDK